MKNNRLITFLFYFFLIVCIVFLILDFMSIIKIDNAIKGGIFLITLTVYIYRWKRGTIKQEEDKILCLNVYDKSNTIIYLILYKKFSSRHSCKHGTLQKKWAWIKTTIPYPFHLVLRSTWMEQQSQSQYDISSRTYTWNQRKHSNSNRIKYLSNTFRMWSIRNRRRFPPVNPCSMFPFRNLQ